MKTKRLLFVAQMLFLFPLSIIFVILPYSTKANHPSSSSSKMYGTLTGSSEVTDTYCGACNGSIDLTISGGQAPYTYLWSNGESTEDLNNLCIGVYEVTVTDASSCTYEGNIFVGNNSFPDVYLETQAEVDDYVANFSFCSSVNGTLRIGTTFANPPSNITDISGLSFITSVGGSLQIFQNHNLNSLNGLQNITTLGSSLNITNNDGLINLVGLPPLTAINGGLTIDNLANLQTLEGLNQLTSVGGSRIYISNTTDLISLSALSQLQNVEGDLDIRICLDLTNLNGLEQLTTIGGDLILRDNITLTDISALDHSISISGALNIENTALSTCAVASICTMLQDGATTDIGNNNSGCNTAAEILDACSGNSISVETTTQIPTCPGECDGSIFATTVSGGAAPYQYEWSNGEMTPDIFNLCSDTYTLTVTDYEGSTFISSYFLPEPPPIVANFLIESTACFGQCTGSITSAITGGLAPYIFDMPFDICPGDYTITVTDSQGCTSEGSFTMTGSEAFNVTLDGITDANATQNDGAIEITIVDGTPPFSFEWISGGTIVSTDEDPSGLAPGDYSLIVIDGTGCRGAWDTYTVGMMVGVDELDKDMTVRIFPNPAKEHIQVEVNFFGSDAIPFTLWNATGHLMKTGLLSQNSGGRGQIGINNLESGVYFLKLEVGTDILVKKVIVK